MFATVELALPRRARAVKLDVVRRLDGDGRNDLFFLSLPSVMRAAGREAQSLNYKRVMEWTTAKLDVKVGKKQVQSPSFASRFPGEEHFLKLGQVFGDGRPDPQDTWFVPLHVAVFLMLRGACDFWSATAASFDLIHVAVKALLMRETAAAFAAGNPERRAVVPAVVVTPPPMQAQQAVSAPARLGLREEPPATPLRVVARPVPMAAPVPPAFPFHAVDAAAALQELVAAAVVEEVPPPMQERAVAVAPIGAPNGPVSLRTVLAQRFQGLNLPDEYGESVPLTASLGMEGSVEFKFVYPGKVEMTRRLELKGHTIALVEAGKTRGPWGIVYRGHGKSLTVLGQYGRRTVGQLSLKYLEKGQLCTAVLLMAAAVSGEIVQCLTSAVQVSLPSDFECVRDRIALDRSLFPLLARQDPASGNAASFRPLLDGQCDLVAFATLEMLVRTTKYNCAHCGVACRATVSFRRSSFRGIECFNACARCGVTTLFFREQLDQSQQLLRRTGAMASIMSFPSTEQLHRFCKLMNLPNYSKLRVTHKRALVESLVASTVRQFGQEHFARQMMFHRFIAQEGARRAQAMQTADRHVEIEKFLEYLRDMTALEQPVTRETVDDAESARRLLRMLRDQGAISDGFAFVKQTSLLLDLVFGPQVLLEGGDLHDGDNVVGADLDNNVELQPRRRALFGGNVDDDGKPRPDPLTLGGDGQHARNARNFGAGHALSCYVALISGTTGAVIIQVTVPRLELAAARDANEERAAAQFPDDANDDEATRKQKRKMRKEWVETQSGYEYDFLGKKFYTNYVLGESAALDLALKILKDNMGELAMAGGLAYDELSSCATTLQKVFPNAKRVCDPWHATKNLRSDIEALEKDKAHEGAFAGLTEFLFPAMRETFKNKATSVDEKVAWARGWQFPVAQLNQRQEEDLQKLKEKIAGALGSTKLGFATSMIESYWSTHSAFWAKGHKYAFSTIEMRMTCQALHWNRVLEWPQQLLHRSLHLL